MNWKSSKTAGCTPGFSLIEVIVAITIMAVLAGAVVPVMFNKLDQVRYERVFDDLQAIYEASMGTQAEGYFGFVGDVGTLPDSVDELIDGTGQGVDWGGPYLALAGGAKFSDVYGNPYVIDPSPIRVRSYGPDGADNSGAGDDLSYPDNTLTTFSGYLEAQVYVNGRLITDATAEQVTASISYSNDGTPASLAMTFDLTNQQFEHATAVHQGKHVLTVVAAMATEDPATTHKEVVTILPGATTVTQVSFSDADYMTRLDTDLNSNDIPDRMEDMDGDGIPDSMDPDIDGDGTPNSIDPDSLDPTVGGGGGGGVSGPTVTNVAPSYATQGDVGTTLTIDGTNFQDGCTVNFSSTGITVTTSPANFVSSTQIVITVNLDLSAATGQRDVTVTNSAVSYGTGSNMFEVLASGGGANPAPTISLVSPDNADLGVASLLISIQGQNFLTGPTITFSNAGVSIVSGPNFIGATEVQVNIDVSGTATPDVGTVTLTNTDTKSAQSAFTLNDVNPSVDALTPNTALRGTNDLVMIISGSGFLAGSVVAASSNIISFDYYTITSSTVISCQIDVGWSGQANDIDITVTNPGGATASRIFYQTR